MLQEEIKTSNKPNPIPNYQVQGDLLQNGVKKPWNVPSLIATLLIKRNMIMSQIQRVRGKPVSGHESTERCVLTPKHVKNMIQQVR